MDILDSPISSISGIGKVREKAYAKLSIYRIEDLLYHFPRGYEDRGNVKKVADISGKEKASLILTVGTEPKKAFIRRGMELIKFSAFDETGVVEITYFNQNYLYNSFPVGMEFRFYGIVEKVGKRAKMTSPDFEPVSNSKPLKALNSVYSKTAGLSQSRIKTDINTAIESTYNIIEDYLPLEIREKNKLCSLPFALKTIHNPDNLETLEKAKRRLIYDEFFLFSCGINQTKKKKATFGAPVCDNNDISKLLALYPYTLTDGQRSAIEDIKKDMARKIPMSRIIVGDVGSGKTLCAVSAMYIAIMSGRQAVLMAPTEILARQHYLEISEKFTKLGIKTAILVGSMTASQKKKVKEELKSGEIQAIVGTHALLSDNVEFFSMGIVITDEQHRFGANQRAILSEKGKHAHVLVMSATPIPRSLALAIYGDLDISKIVDMPKGRQRVDTFVVNENYRDRLIEFIKKQVFEGSQVYIVCPSVEEKETEDDEDNDILFENIGALAEHSVMPPLKATVQYAEELKSKLKGIEVAYVHGKMKAQDKDDVMMRFAKGEIQVLVSTTVIEVGVNVPNATLMIVENAERFGLSGLHQLRGRVGRGNKKSYCVLVSDAESEKSKARLDIMKNEYNGFIIAEKDLEMRGPGDFLRNSVNEDIRQSGGLNFRIADMSNDSELLNTASLDAKEYIEKQNGFIENKLLKARIEKMFSIDEDTIN